MTSAPVNIQNTKPEVTNVLIVESAPRSSDDLNVDYTFIDIDNDLETFSRHRWFVDHGTGSGWEYSGYDTETLSYIYTKKGEKWKFG